MKAPFDSAATFRAFIGVDLPAEVRSRLADMQAALRATGADAGYPKAADLHLTLAFLGDILPDTARAIAGALDRIAAAMPPFAFRVAGAGCFGPAAAPRVVWAGVPACPPLQTLQLRVTDAVRALGVPLEDRPFAPHITLARIRGVRNLPALTSAVSSFRSNLFGEVQVSRIILMRSNLDLPHTRYTEESAAHLKGS